MKRTEKNVNKLKKRTKKKKKKKKKLVDGKFMTKEEEQRGIHPHP